MLASVDLGRLVYQHQILTDLTREAANLVSRGATFEVAFTVTGLSAQIFDIDTQGGIIISHITGRDASDDTPWVVEQRSQGGLSTLESRVGQLNAAANVPGIKSLSPGVTITAVEIMHQFEPVFAFAAMGLNFYPEALYDAAFF